VFLSNISPSEVTDEGTINHRQIKYKVEKLLQKRNQGHTIGIRFSIPFSSGVKAAVCHHLVLKGEYLGWLEIKRNQPGSRMSIHLTLDVLFVVLSRPTC